jgi:hypothetical protein
MKEKGGDKRMMLKYVFPFLISVCYTSYVSCHIRVHVILA